MSDDKYAGFKFGLTDTREDARERKDEKRAEREDPKHLAFVRKQVCIVAGRAGALGVRHSCKGTMAAHHEPSRGTRTLWHDRKTVPLCAKAHTERHAIGKTRFERRYGVDIEAECKRLDELNK